MSSSAIREAAFCWGKWIRAKEKQNSQFMTHGDVLDALIMPVVTFDSKFAIQPEEYHDEKTGKYKPWTDRSNTCKAWNADQKGKGRIVIDKNGTDKKPGLVEAQEAKARILGDELLRSFIQSSDFQVHVTGEWHDSATGLVIPCQCLIDLMPKADSEWRRCLGDLKTARSAYPPFWRKDSSERGYHIQAAWNLAMFCAATGELRDTFCWLISENTHPWEVGHESASFGDDGDDQIPLDQITKLDLGRRTFEAWMAQYAACLASGKWPGYDDKPEAMGGWSIDKAEARDVWAAQRAIAGQTWQSDAPEQPQDQNDLIP